MPGTWASEGVDGDGDGVRDPFDPADAIASQASFMCKLLGRCHRRHQPDRRPDRPRAGRLQRRPRRRATLRRRPALCRDPGLRRRIRTLMAELRRPGRHAPPAPARPAPGPGPSPGRSPPATGRAGAGCTPAPTSAPRSAPRSTPPATAPCSPPAPPAATDDWVKLAHPGGTTTVYGHISREAVTVGQAVQAGQLIAYSGNEGRSTGPHLHFEVRPNDRPVDPVAFYAAHGARLG